MQRCDRLLRHQVESEEAVLDHREHERRRADLEVRRHLGQVGVADDDVEPSVLLRIRVRLVAGVDDGPLERGLESDLDLEVVGTLADLEAVRPAVLAQAYPAGPGHDLPRDEEWREVTNDVGEWRRALHEVVLMRAVRRALVVGVVLVQVDRRRSRDERCASSSLGHDSLASLVPDHDVARIGALRRGVLRVRVVDVQPRSVGQDDVGETEVLIGQLARIGELAGQVEPARIAQRVLLLEVPPWSPRLRRRPVGVGVDDLRRGQHGVGGRLAGDRDAVLGLRPHDAPDAHGAEPTSRRRSSLGIGSHSPSATEQDQRYWPVLAMVSIDRPASVPCLPDTSVRI